MQPSNYNIKGIYKEAKGSYAFPQSGGHSIILNLCDMTGGHWDKNSPLGEVMKRWGKTELEYRRWFLRQEKFLPGEVQEIVVQSSIYIANALVFNDNNELIPGALEKAIDKVGIMAYEYGSSVHVHKHENPKIWKEVNNLLFEKIIKRSKNVTIYKKED